MTDDHEPERDTNIGRWCDQCALTRHGDCGPICRADRDDKQ